MTTAGCLSHRRGEGVGKALAGPGGVDKDAAPGCSGRRGEVDVEARVAERPPVVRMGTVEIHRCIRPHGRPTAAHSRSTVVPEDAHQ